MTDDFEDPGKTTVKRDNYGRYLLPECVIGPARKKELPFTRATTFAKSISDTFTLSQWSQRMVAKGIATRQDLRMAAATLDVTADRDQFNGICEDAKEAAAGKVAARLGSAIHAFTEQADRGEVVDAQEFTGHVDAYTATLSSFSIKVIPTMIERIVVCKQYSIAGKFDRIVMWGGRPVVLDLKTGKDLQYGWNEIAIQLWIYANADGVWDPVRWQWEAMPDGLRTDTALVLHLPAGRDADANVYEVDLEPAGKAVALCAAVREWRKYRHLATLLAPPAPGAPSQDWGERIRSAASKGDLLAIWGEMTPTERYQCKPAFVARSRVVAETEMAR